MISLRTARPADAPAIGAVHVAAWRSAYPGILPDDYLARLSVARQAAHYEGAIRGPGGVFVAVASGTDVPLGSSPRIVGFTTAGRGRGGVLRLVQGVCGSVKPPAQYRTRDWRRRLSQTARQ